MKKLLLITLSLTVATIYLFAEKMESKHPAEGKALFDKNCLACHQAGAQGKVGFAPAIGNPDFLALASDDYIKNSVKKGRPGTAMVPRPDLKDEELQNIIVYLRSLPVALPKTVKVDWDVKFSGSKSNGEQLFAEYCAGCHGPTGEGYSKGGAGTGIGLKGFLETASDDYILQTLKTGRAGTPMRIFIGAKGLANLSEQEAKDIIAFLRSLAD